MKSIQFLNYSPKQLQDEITATVKKRLKKEELKRKNKPFKKSQEALKIIQVILQLQHIALDLLHNYHQEILGLLFFAKNIFMKWLL